jgi:hypothetical protein
MSEVSNHRASEVSQAMSANHTFNEPSLAAWFHTNFFT